MLRKGITAFLLFFLLCRPGFAQEISHQVLVPAAGLKYTGIISYSQTIGETAVELTGKGPFLTQGFQQPGIKIMLGIKPNGDGVKSYPNPATDYVSIELFGDVTRSYSIAVLNLNGVAVMIRDVSYTGSYWDVQDFTVSSLPMGLYFIRVTSGDGQINRVFKFEKI
jgi:hypothetical protein